MNRKPETKAAAQLLSKAFAAQGVTLGHQAALNLLATIEGFESFAHMKAAQVAAPVSRQTEPAGPTEFVTYLVFGEEETEALQEARDSQDEEALRDALTAAKKFSFPTKAQLDAFLEGVDEACGWMKHEQVDEEMASMA
jgi:hypothetical protein